MTAPNTWPDPFKVAATLCSVLGKECLKIMNSLPFLTADGKTKPKKILEELRAHFIPQNMSCTNGLDSTQQHRKEKLLMHVL